MNLAALRKALIEIGTSPTRSLGQNFLHEEGVSRWIVEQLDLQPGEHLVEIGPGLGSLTEFAVNHDGPITLIEKDGRLADYLKERFADRPNIEVRHMDALHFDTRELFKRGPAKILGNLPYYVSSQVLLQFTADPSCVGRLIFTLQKEMAERLSARPSSKDYGALTLLVGRKWKVDYLKTLPGSVFFPAPNVESGVIALSPRDPREYPDCDGALFNRLVKEGFSQRRKMLRKMLASHQLDWEALCKALQIEETVRGEALSLGQWIDLARYVENFKNPGILDTPAQEVHAELFDVVDDQNNVISQATRHDVHAQRLNHRAIHVLLSNKRGDLFLQKRSHLKDANPGRWDSSASGHLHAGDDYLPTAYREVTEELGVTLPEGSLELIGQLPASRETGHEFVSIYAGNHSGPFTWPRAEIEIGSFFPVSLLDEWTAARPKDFSLTFLQCYKIWRERH